MYVPSSILVLVVGEVGGVGVWSVVCGGRVVGITVQELEDGTEILSHERFDGDTLMGDRSVSNEENAPKLQESDIAAVRYNYG